MPAVNTESVTRREAAIKKAVAALGADADPIQRRKMAKKLRRVQRRRRILAVQDKKRAGKPAEAEAKAE